MTISELVRKQKKMSGLFDGEKGESIFIKPLMDFSHMIDADNKLHSFFDKMAKSGDDRSFVIISASLVDNMLDEIMKEFIPKYDLIEDDLTISMKIKLLRGFKFLPVGILSCADCVRRIRNYFAHQINLESLDNMPSEDKDAMKTLYLQFYEDAEVHQKSSHDLFKEVAELSIFGLIMYKPNMAELRKTVESEEFLSELEKKSSEKFNAQLNLAQESLAKGYGASNLKIKSVTLKSGESKSISFDRDE